MRYCHFGLDPNKPEALALLQQINTDLCKIGLEIDSQGELIYDETDEALMEKLKAIFDKYPKEFSLS